MSTSIPASPRPARILQNRIRPLVLAVSALTLALSLPRAAAQDNSALIDALVREGVLTQEKAENIRTDLQRDLATTSAGKIKLSSSVTELKLYGDLRLRYQYDDRQLQVPDSGNVGQQSRYRFRLRLNAEVKLGRDWAAGFSLGTGQPSDSEEQTFENGFDDYNIYITKAYLSWQPNDWLTVVGGKQKNPFYTTDLLWDPDITPTGLTETIAFHKLPFFGGGSAGASGGFGKEGKSIAAPDARPAENPWEVTFVAGQFVFDDNGEFNLDSDFGTDAYLFVEQLIATYKFNKDTSVTLAPAFYTFTAADLTGLTNANPFTDQGELINGTTQLQTTTTDAVQRQVTYSAAGVPTVVLTPLTTTTAAETTVTPTTGPRTITTTQQVARSTQTTQVGTASGLPNNPALAGRQFTTTEQGASRTVTTTNNVRLPAVSGETRQLHILAAPGDVSFKLGGLKSKLYWDVAYNFGGRERYEDIYQLAGTDNGYSSRDALAWLVGVQVGEVKKKGDWAAYLNYRETGIASIDPNLNDSNFGLSELNTRGFKLSLAYQLADAVVLSVTGYVAWNLDHNLVGGRATNNAQTTPSSPNGIADANAANVLQVDLSIKF